MKEWNFLNPKIQQKHVYIGTWIADGQVLRIANASKKSDEATYTCTGRNRASVASSSALLRVSRAGMLKTHAFFFWVSS